MVVIHRSFSFDGNRGYSPLSSLGSQLLPGPSPPHSVFPDTIPRRTTTECQGEGPTRQHLVDSSPLQESIQPQENKAVLGQNRIPGDQDSRWHLLQEEKGKLSAERGENE